MTLGERMKEARLYCGMTQPEVAGKLGVTFQTISSWEKNRTSPTPQDLLQLSEIYNTSIYDLLGKPTPDTPFGRAVLNIISIFVGGVTMQVARHTVTTAPACPRQELNAG